MLGFVIGVFICAGGGFWNQEYKCSKIWNCASFVSDIRAYEAWMSRWVFVKRFGKMISEFVETEDGEEESRPNVIVIMNESFL